MTKVISAEELMHLRDGCPEQVAPQRRHATNVQQPCLSYDGHQGASAVIGSPLMLEGHFGRFQIFNTHQAPCTSICSAPSSVKDAT